MRIKGSLRGNSHLLIENYGGIIRPRKGGDQVPHCIPIRDLKNTADISQMCQKSREPIFITKNGYEDMVIMSAEVYDKIRLYSIYEKLMEAEADIAEGRVTDAYDSLRKLRAKHGL